MARANPSNVEIPSFGKSLLRKPLRSQMERELSGSNRQISEPLFPVVNDSRELDDYEIHEGMYAPQNGGEEHSVGSELVCDPLEINGDVHDSAHDKISRRSRSREKDSLPSPDKNEKVRQRNTRKPVEESRKSPDRDEDPPELSPLGKNKGKPPSKGFKYDMPSKPNLGAVKASHGPGNKYKLEYTPECTVISTTKDVSSVVIKIVLVLAFIFASYAIRKSLFSNSHEKRVTFNYQSIVSSFQPSFKDQPDFSFKILKSALNSINKTDPSAPAVILFLASKGAEELARSLGEKLVDSVTPSPIKIYGKDYENLDSDSGKKIIDDTLRSMNSDSEYGAVLVEDLHRIPGETALMLHTYCDNENAPYKHAVYALIVHMEEPIPVNSKMKDWDIAVYKRLNRAWSDIDEDQRGPLLSRLTVSVTAIVKKDIKV